MAGKLYAVGVGPGDPDLLTLKAVKTIKNADCIACPDSHGVPGVAYRIAEQAVPEISKKELILLEFPMRKGDLCAAHQEAADRLALQLSSGKDIAFLTLGAPEFYSTFFYVADIIREQGYEIDIVGGITSFSAVSARLKLPLALGNDPVMISVGKYCDFEGTLVILKGGSRLKELKEQAAINHKSACMVENCGMPEEKVYYDLRSIPDEAGYFSVVIIK